ncbi:dienelactone hydrolase family protein, partial [Pseudoxanthomonas sp. SGD-10]
MKNFSTLLFILTMVMNMQAQELKTISYQDRNQKLNGLVTSNTQKNLAGVLILPAWKGIDNEAKQAAIDLQKAGYIAFIADVYGEGNIPKNNASAATMSGKYKQDYRAYQQRIQLALDELVRQGANPNKIAVIGYCFGGTGALEAARGGLPVTGVVCIHGSLNKAPNRPNGLIKTKVLVEHPAE